MKPDDFKFVIVLLQILRNGEIISDAAARIAAKKMEKLCDESVLDT